jgi:hypothetical protein
MPVMRFRPHSKWWFRRLGCHDRYQCKGLYMFQSTSLKWSKKIRTYINIVPLPQKCIQMEMSIATKHADALNQGNAYGPKTIWNKSWSNSSWNGVQTVQWVRFKEIPTGLQCI